MQKNNAVFDFSGDNFPKENGVMLIGFNYSHALNKAFEDGTDLISFFIVEKKLKDMNYKHDEILLVEIEYCNSGKNFLYPTFSMYDNHEDDMKKIEKFDLISFNVEDNETILKKINNFFKVT